MSTVKSIGMVLLMSLLLAGCAGLYPGYQEKPQVNITSFGLAPQSTGVAPRFRIGLQVVNPNSRALTLNGMSYSVAIQGNRVLSGAQGNLPTVPAYGMADFTIEASPDLFGSARLLGGLFNNPRNSLDYSFKAKLDVGRLWPNLTIEENGTFTPSSTGQR